MRRSASIFSIGRLHRPMMALACALALAASASAAVNGNAPFARWIDGTAAAEPEMQVQAIDPDTFVIRQSVRTNFEAPFLYLLFGRDRALLLDSGAGGLLVRPTIDRVIDGWLRAHGRSTIPLVVAHSHSHGDHIAGDGEFRARSDTVVVGLLPQEVATFFGIAHWPQDLGGIDLGGRQLKVIPTPGHQPAHIMIYDPQTEFLLSGDALYPGRLYVPVNHMPEERASIDRVVAFVRTHPIRAALGAHIEMTRDSGRDYPRRAAPHPNEHRLELPPTALAELQAGLRAPLDTPETPQVHGDFILYPTKAN